MSGRYGPVVQRALLTSELQKLRHGRDERQESVAKALDWSISKIIRIEGGKIGISRTDLEALLRHYDVTDRDRTKALVELARGAKEKGWWDKYKITDRAFGTFLGYEAGASSIQMVQGLLVPGTLQTEQYARAITSIFIPGKEVDNVVKLRMERRDKIFERATRQCYIMDEAVISRRGAAVMRGQLQYLATVIEDRPEITVRIIPFTAGPHFGMRGPFTLLSFDAGLDDVLYMENARGGDLMIAGRGGETVAGGGTAVIRGEDDAIAEYRDAFEGLVRIALDRDASLDLIMRVADDM